MAFPLTLPTIGDINWGGVVNANWTTLNDAFQTLATFTGDISQTGAKTFSTGTGAVSLNGATTVLTSGTALTTVVSDTATATQPDGIFLSHRSSNTPIAAFGICLRMAAESSTTNDRSQFLVQSEWVDATDASRTSRAGLYVFDTAAREAIRMQASGSAPMIGFLGAAAIVRPASTTDLRTALINLGLYTTGGASPLNLNGGALTAAAGSFSGNISQTGATTLSTGSGAVSLNGPITVNPGTATSAVTITQGTITSAAVIPINSTVTWNAAVAFTAWKLNVTNTSSSATSLLLDLQVGAVSKFQVDRAGNAAIAQTAITTGSPTALRVTGGAHTTLTASTEASDVNFSLARTVQWATGALATQRAVRIQAPTYGFVGASTITTASTLAIGGAPVAGTNATLTNSFALNVESGSSNFAGSIIGALGTVSLPQYTFTGDINTGLYSPGADQIALATNGVARLSLSTSVATFTIINVLPASTTSAASLRVPHGTAPTAPTDGDVWTTTTGLFLRLNGVTNQALLNQDNLASVASFGVSRANINQGRVALTDGASIATDAATGNVFSVTLAGNRTLANPTNLKDGATYIWIITQDGTGSRTLAYGANFKWPGGVVPTLSTAAGAVDVICAIWNGTVLMGNVSKQFS